MKLTAKGRYAVTAVAALARRGGGAVSLRTLSDEQGISLSFLEQMFAQLRRAGIVASQRGARGGYRLAIPPEELTLDRIIHAVDVDIRAQGCTPERRSACTGQGEQCLTHDLWHALEQHVESFFAGVTVADVISERVPA